MLLNKKLMYNQLLSRKLSDISYFKIAIYLFYITPIIFVSYLYMMSINANQSFFTPIIEDPVITIMFVIAMMNPFCGILTKIAVNDLQNKKQISLSRLTLQMMALSQLLAGNIFSSLAIFLGLWRQWKEKKYRLDKNEFNWKSRGSILRLSGNMLILFLSLLSLFFLLKIAVH